VTGSPARTDPAGATPTGAAPVAAEAGSALSEPNSSGPGDANQDGPEPSGAHQRGAHQRNAHRNGAEPNGGDPDGEDLGGGGPGSGHDRPAFRAAGIGPDRAVPADPDGTVPAAGPPRDRAGAVPQRTGWVLPSARRALPRGPTALAAVLVVLAVFGLWAPGGAGWRGLGSLIFGTVCTGSAWAVLAFGPEPRNRCGLAMAALAGLTLGSAATQTLAGWGVPGLDQVSQVAYLVALGVVAPAAAVLYPDGRLPGWLARGCALFGILAAAAAAALSWVDVRTTISLGSVALVLLVASGWARFVSVPGRQRRALQWLAWSCVETTLLVVHVMFLGEALAVDLPRSFFVITLALAALLPPVCAAIGVIDPDLLDIRWLIRRSAVWTVTLESAFAATAGTVAAVELVTGDPPERSAVTVLCVVVAVLFHPAMGAFEKVVDSVLFGGQVDPVQALAGLGERFDAGGDPASWLPALRAGLALPYLELWGQDERLATAGTLPGQAHPAEEITTTTVALAVGDERVGALVVGLPPQVHTLPPATRDVLRLVAPPLAQALRAAALTEQLRDSRSQLVEALEEERRRLRRDLHDGLGPIMTGVAYSADAARNLVPVDPDRAQEVLTDLRADTAAAINEIRRIVYGLRPPALDELGLVAAIRQGCNRLRAADGRAMAVVIEAPGDLPPLPAAVEVAAYRIALEAVTNAARHSGSAEVRLAVEARAGRLLITARDGGRRAAADWRPGVGIQSMRERAEQVGGRLTASPGPTGGEVHAELPFTSG